MRRTKKYEKIKEKTREGINKNLISKYPLEIHVIGSFPPSVPSLYFRPSNLPTSLPQSPLLFPFYYHRKRKKKEKELKLEIVTAPLGFLPVLGIGAVHPPPFHPIPSGEEGSRRGNRKKKGRRPWKLNLHVKEVCTFYQKGMCSYGNRCRYQHVKANRIESAASSSSPPALSSNSRRFSAENGDSVGRYARKGSSKATMAQGASVELSALSVPFFLPGKQVRTDPGEQNLPRDYAVVEPRNVKPEDLPLCSFAAARDCPRGDKCPHVHGDLCPTCGKHCLHPFRAKERDEHLKSCEKKQKHLEALKHSQEIECSVCLDRVLSKSTAAERKFGLLSECDHPFCISCIRNWRNSSPSSGVDVNTAVRACPMCRKVSYFVIPSVIWYTSKDEKEEIVDNYKAKLRSIDCKHFDFGNGNCPFGTSCFYKHTVRPGSYMWKYQRPPPRIRRPSRYEYDIMALLEMDELCDLFDHLLDGDLDPIDADDYDHIDLAYILMQSFGSSDSSSDDENYIF